MAKFVRTRGKKIQTAEVTYYNSELDKTVKIIGLMHIADSDYFQEINNYIKSIGNYSVYYERLLESNSERTSKLEQLALDKLEEHFLCVRLMAKIFDLSYQSDNIIYEGSWNNTDISDLDLVRIIGPQKVLTTFKSNYKSITSLENLGTFPKKIARKFVIWMIGRSKSLHPAVFLDWRNFVAMSAILADNNNILALWGANHLVGMSLILESNGYVLQSKRWFTAIKK